MKPPHVPLGEDLQAEGLGILGGTVHGKASIAVAFSVLVLRPRRHYQAPEWLNAAYCKLEIGLTFTTGMVESGVAKWESQGMVWEKHGDHEANRKIRAWFCFAVGQEEPELVTVIS